MVKPFSRKGDHKRRCRAGTAPALAHPRPVVATLIILACFLLAACGGTAPKSNVLSCAERHEMGACIPGKPAVAAPLTARGPLCVDISQWQGWYPNLNGVRCVIIQANYGLNVEPSVYEQIRDARNHGIPFGCYTFLEPGASGEQEAALANSVCSISRGRTLGLWADAELNGTYEHACPYTGWAASHGIHIEGLYTSPGLWPGGRCAGYLWPAEWGGGWYPFGGYPSSAVKIRQWCGQSCFVHGVEMDLDEDLGVLALAKPAPAPSKRALQRRLVVLRADLTRHHCRKNTPHQYQLCARWFREGDATTKELGR